MSKMIGPSNTVLWYAPVAGWGPSLSSTAQPPMMTAATAPALAPPTTAQASAGPASQVAVTGMTPIRMACGYCSSAVESRASTVTTRSVTSRGQVRRAGTEYASVLTAVQTIIAPSTTHAQAQWA